MKKVAIASVGVSGFNPTTPDVSYRELTYEAAVKAYSEAGIEPKDIDGFVVAAEDFCEGYSISDEYCPDQLGAVLKPVCTVPGDYLHALATAVMMIRTGVFKTVVVEGHSKLSNMKNHWSLLGFAMDPVLDRRLGESYRIIDGLEMARYLHETGTTEEQCASVVVKLRKAALKNPLASYGAALEIEDVIRSDPIAYPLKALDVAHPIDGAIVTVLAAEDVIGDLTDKPVWIAGISWYSDSPSFETRELGYSPATRLAAKKAYQMAGIANPRRQIDLFEISDETSYKALIHAEELGLCRRGEAGFLFETGEFGPDGAVKINPSGGELGVGDLFEAKGGHKLYEVVKQLRGEAGSVQVEGATTGLVHAWRGAPSTSCVVAILKV